MKKVVFVIGGMGRGGAERVISILSNQLVKMNYDVDIVLLLKNVVEYDLDKRIRIIDLTQKSSSYCINFLKWVFSLHHYLKKNRPDVLISFIARVNIVSILAAIGINTKIIVSERSDPDNDGRSMATDIVTKALYQTVNKVVFQTKRAQKHFGTKVQEKSIIIPNPICVSRLCEKDNKHKIVTVGRLQPEKNHKMLIEAFARIEKKYPEYRLWIYGDGPLKDDLYVLAKSFGVENKVNLPGSFLDVHTEIADSEIFVLPSLHEGLSNALLEAMMMGLPCISTACGGAEEYIINDKNGFVIPIGDITQLEKTLEYLILNPAKRRTIGENGKKAVKKCEKNIVISEWINLINN